MSSINSVTKLQKLYFSQKNKKNKKSKKWRKKMARYQHLYILLLIYMDLGLELIGTYYLWVLFIQLSYL